MAVVPIFSMLTPMGKLTAAEIQNRLQELTGWTLEGDAIRRQFTFPSFPDAITFVDRLAFDAETADHHPDILINYKRVTLTYSTHSEGGLTTKDFDGARLASALAARLLPSQGRT
jgi:4a-hydroxytetrahydrobiopterin dehydratase